MQSSMAVSSRFRGDLYLPLLYLAKICFVRFKKAFWGSDYDQRHSSFLNGSKNAEKRLQ